MSSRFPGFYRLGIAERRRALGLAAGAEAIDPGGLSLEAADGIGMTRRMFKRQAALVASGGDPVGAGPGFQRLIDIRAGNAFLDPETGAMLVGITPPWEDL